MAKKENPKDKKTSRRNPPESEERGSPRSKKRALAAVVVAIVLVGIIITAFVFSLNRVPIGSATSGSLQSFISGLNTSNTVRIFVSDPNSTVYVNTTYCGTSFIYQIEKAHNIHKAPSSIDFFVLSPNNSCTYAVGLQNASNYSTTTTSKCLSISSQSPSIFINYSATNFTKVYGNSLYISGTNRYLFECAGAAELT